MSGRLPTIDWEHLVPVLDALPEDRRGHLYANRSLRGEVPSDTIFSHPPPSKAPLLLGGYQDTNTVHRPKVLLQHGAAQTYAGCQSPSYSGGPGRDAVGLFLCPRESDAQKNRDRYSGALACAVGSPKLDGWADVPAPHNDPLVVGVTFHWPAHLHRERTDGSREMIPEAGWAFQSWRDTIPLLREEHVVVGHGHPRARRLLENYWAGIGVEAEWDARRLLGRVDVLIGDNTSLLYEFAAVGRPVICLNDADWRPDVEHGLRFWGQMPGPDVWPIGGLDGIREAIRVAREAWWAGRRREVSDAVYGPVDGHASERAVAAILEWEQRGCPHRAEYGTARPCGC